METKTKNKAMAVLQAYKKTFSSEYGQIVLHDLMDVGGVFKSSYVENNINGVAYNEDSRALALYILTKLGTSSKDTEKMFNDLLIYQSEEDYG